MRRRTAPLPLLLTLAVLHTEVRAQRIDSVRIFLHLPQRSWTTASAEATGWQLWRQRAPAVQVPTDDLEELNTVLNGLRPLKHHHARLPALSHLGFAYVNRGLHVFCLTDDAGRVIDLTTRHEFVIADLLDRLKVRAWLLTKGL